MDDPLLENLSPRTIEEIAGKIKKQVADPKDAIRLMLLFCDLVKSNKDIPKELLKHIADAFKKIVAGELNANRALGIKRSNNRPKANEDERATIAHRVLHYRLQGKNFTPAVELTAAEYEIGTTVAKQSWSECKEQALNTELMYRHLNHLPFLEREKKILDKIYKGEKFYLSPFYSNTKAD